MKPGSRSQEDAADELDEFGPLGGRCAICGTPSTTQQEDPVPEPVSAGHENLGDRLPPVELCDEHWSHYRTDWLLLGWCVDHYGEALRHCPRHDCVIQPL